MSIQSRIGRLEAATVCRACELIAAHAARVRDLIARQPEKGKRAPLVSFTARSFCAWCGRVEVTEQRATPEGVSDLRAVWEGLNAGRMCAPEVAAAYDRIVASLDASLGPRAGEYHASMSELSAALAALPSARFPYVCRIADCPCSYPKRAAA